MLSMGIIPKISKHAVDFWFWHNMLVHLLRWPDGCWIFDQTTRPRWTWVPSVLCAKELSGVGIVRPFSQALSMSLSWYKAGDQRYLDGWDPFKPQGLLQKELLPVWLQSNISSSQLIFPLQWQRITLDCSHQEQLSESETLEVEADLELPRETEVCVLHDPTDNHWYGRGMLRDQWFIFTAPGSWVWHSPRSLDTLIHHPQPFFLSTSPICIILYLDHCMAQDFMSLT
jgi:hypothetical protein